MKISCYTVGLCTDECISCFICNVQLLSRFQEVPLSRVFQLIHTHLEVTGSAKAQVSPGFINYARGNDATECLLCVLLLACELGNQELKGTETT